MKVKFGILGCGRIGERHAKHIINHSQAQLVGFFDIKKEKRKSFLEKTKAQEFENKEALLESNLDIVNICTPNGTHAKEAVSVLEKGKHVLVEKPMALSRADCEMMINTALKNNKHLFVVKQNRYNPPIQEVKKLLDSGDLGKVYYVVVNCYWNRNERYYEESDWKGSKALDGGVLFTQFSHFIDIIYFLFGELSNYQGLVKKQKLDSLIDFEDTGSFTFNFKNIDALGAFNYTIVSHGQNMEGSITLFTEKGTIKIGGQYLNTLEYCNVDKGIKINEIPTSNSANDYGYYQGSMSNHDKVIHNVVETLNGRETIMTNAMEGLKVVEMIENIYNAVQWM